MTTTWKQLSRPLRTAIAAPWCLLATVAAIAATPATRQLLLDSANAPTEDVNLESSHWVGTLDPARLPASVAYYDGGQGLSIPGNAYVDGTLYADEGIYEFSGLPIVDSSGTLYTNCIRANGNDPSIDFSDPHMGCLRDDGLSCLEWTYGGVVIPGSLRAGNGIYDENGNLTLDASGNFYMHGGIYTAYGQQVLDSSGNLILGHDLFLGGDLCFSTQNAQPGTITPTSTLVVYDASGTACLVPCAPQ